MTFHVFRKIGKNDLETPERNRSTVFPTAFEHEGICGPVWQELKLIQIFDLCRPLLRQQCCQLSSIGEPPAVSIESDSSIFIWMWQPFTKSYQGLFFKSSPPNGLRPKGGQLSYSRESDHQEVHCGGKFEKS